MKPSRAIAALVLLLVACEPVPDQPSVREPTTEPAGTPDRDLSFPGGGRILFIQDGWRGFGIVASEGTVQGSPLRNHTFPYWDPAASDRLLMLPFDPPAKTISVEIVDGAMRRIGSWRTSPLFNHASLEGRTIAFVLTDRSGRVREGVLGLLDRVTGETEIVPSDGLSPVAWTPTRELLATPWSGGSLVRWDPTTGARSRFGPGRISDVNWDPQGHRYAARIATGGSDPRGVVVIGDRDGDVTERIPVGRRWVEMATWSPDGDRLAFIVRGGGSDGHRTASLHVYDLSTRMDSVVAHPVSDAFWAAWSPDGRWLVMDDWTRERWLFVAADGSQRTPYPWLGHFPRWCCPSSPPISVQIRVS